MKSEPMIRELLNTAKLTKLAWLNPVKSISCANSNRNSEYC